MSEEQEKIIKYIHAGMSNMEIAEELGYSESTIKKRITKIYKTFKVTSRLGLIKKNFYTNDI
jgi:DNA-binding NarL/FixJ family response regulator